MKKLLLLLLTVFIGFGSLTVTAQSVTVANGTDVNNVGDNGNYWSSTANDSNNAYNLNFNDSNVNPDNNDNRNNGYSVRLVRAFCSGCFAGGTFPILLQCPLQQTQYAYADAF